MRRLLGACVGVLLIAAPLQAALINGVSNITDSSGNNNPVPGGTVLTNTGTVLDGLYGTKNLGYLVDGFSTGLGYDGLVIKATVVVNDEGTVSGADNGALLGYSNPVTGHRTENNFGINLHGPNDGRIFLMIGGGMHTTLGNWASAFGRNNPFDVVLNASLAGNQLTVTGSITESDTPANTIPVNVVATVNPATQSSAFGTSQGFEQPNETRNFGVDFSNVMYCSPDAAPIPEPVSLLMLLLGAVGCLGFRR